MSILTPQQQSQDQALQSIIKLAVMAVGGQGGGVLTKWIEHTARAQGYAVQATSVPGVAQRTGATIFYLEMAPISDRSPVFSLAPANGDVDILIAAEMMEAGRAIMRGFVTPERTTLIASTHRSLAVSEKMVPGDGIADANVVRGAALQAAKQVIMFDMDQVATQNGSVISSSLLGALAGSGALPFPLEAFEEAIRASGKGVQASLNSFHAAAKRAQSDHPEMEPTPQAAATRHAVQGPERALKKWQALAAEAQSFPAADMVMRGLEKVADFQDLKYAQEYLGRVRQFADIDPENAALTEAAAKYIARAMCYDDIIRVADLKTRRTRFDRIHADIKPGDAQLHLTEFFHPRAEEMVSLLPTGLARWIKARPGLFAWLDRRINKGRRVRTDRLSGFLTLYIMGGMKGMRRASLRHAEEQQHLQAWQDTCLTAARRDVPLGIELLACRRLIKGYSDTHARGLSKFDRVMQALPMIEHRDDAARWVARLREAALQDEKGEQLDGAIKTVQSFQ